MRVEKHITIKEHQEEFIDDLNLSISAIAQDALDEQMDELGWEPEGDMAVDDSDSGSD